MPPVWHDVFLTGLRSKCCYSQVSATFTKRSLCFSCSVLHALAFLCPCPRYVYDPLHNLHLLALGCIIWHHSFALALVHKMAGAIGDSWQSLDRKSGWPFEDVQVLADQWSSLLPEGAKRMLRTSSITYFVDYDLNYNPRHFSQQETWLTFANNIQTAKMQPCRPQDLRRNHVWVMAPILIKPHSVMSGYLIADGLVELDKQLQGTLLQVADALGMEPCRLPILKAELALQEAWTIKRLVQYARHLYRNAPSSKFKEKGGQRPHIGDSALPIFSIS